MSWAFDAAEEKQRISFKGPEGEHLLQVALRAHTASPEELKELAAKEYDAHWERKHEIERLWGDDPDEPPLAERWHEQQEYEEICDAIRNPQKYVGQAREQGLLPAAEPGLKETPSRSLTAEAVDAPHAPPKQGMSVPNEPSAKERARWFERSKRAIRSQKTLAIIEKISDRERDKADIGIEL